MVLVICYLRFIRAGIGKQNKPLFNSSHARIQHRFYGSIDQATLTPNYFTALLIFNSFLYILPVTIALITLLIVGAAFQQQIDLIAACCSPVVGILREIYIL